MQNVLVLRHLAFEDLGRLEPLLEQAGFRIRYLDVGVDALSAVSPLNNALVVVLGGPISAYDLERYPYLATEIAWLRARLLEDLPTLGICLGAQLMAAALGARVYPGKPGPEIGWARLTPGRHAASRPYLREFIDSNSQVLHWHGDTFDLPEGAMHLAASQRYENQAFAWGRYGLALQFHAEFESAMLERWLIGHSHEIAHTPGASLRQLRADTALHGATSASRADRFWRSWLASIERLPTAVELAGH